jgi:hypothetical protein
MDFYDIVDQIIDLLKQRGRVSYRALNRGRKGLSPSPPSEPCRRFSRTRLSSRWLPHRD